MSPRFVQYLNRFPNPQHAYFLFSTTYICEGRYRAKFDRSAKYSVNESAFKVEPLSAEMQEQKM